MNAKQKINRIRQLRGYQKHLSKQQYSKDTLIDVECEIQELKEYNPESTDTIGDLHLIQML